MLLSPEHIIAVETDAVFSTVPLDLPHSERLGDWEETTFDEITYIQSGFYYGLKDGKVICKYRGMDKAKDHNGPEGLPYEEVMRYLQEHTGTDWGPPQFLLANTTRFIGMGLGLRTKATWRSWERNQKYIRLNRKRNQRGGTGKRFHCNAECELCRQGITMYDQLHRMEIGGYSGHSYAKEIPWREIDGVMVPPIDFREWSLMWQDSEQPWND